jgi:hypothetical protein
LRSGRAGGSRRCGSRAGTDRCSRKAWPAKRNVKAGVEAAWKRQTAAERSTYCADHRSLSGLSDKRR